MATYVILSKLSPDAFQDPKEFKKLADAVAITSVFRVQRPAELARNRSCNQRLSAGRGLAHDDKCHSSVTKLQHRRG